MVPTRTVASTFFKVDIDSLFTDSYTFHWFTPLGGCVNHSVGPFFDFPIVITGRAKPKGCFSAGDILKFLVAATNGLDRHAHFVRSGQSLSMFVFVTQLQRFVVVSSYGCGYNS